MCLGCFRTGDWQRPTCSVHAGMVRVVIMIVRIMNEAGSCLLRIVQVLPRQLNSADHELPRHAHRQQLQLLVQNIAAHVVDWPPNGHRGPALELSSYIVACSQSRIQVGVVNGTIGISSDCLNLQMVRMVADIIIMPANPHDVA